jgi:CheY-like chemotaxis protein
MLAGLSDCPLMASGRLQPDGSFLRPTSSTPLSVLLVDDSEAFRYAIARSLTGNGYRVREASNGDEALDVLADEVMGAMVVDLVMPGLNGIELLRILARRNPRPPMHIVACTGILPISEHLRAVLRPLGVTTLLGKPFTTEELLQALKS